MPSQTLQKAFGLLAGKYTIFGRVIDGKDVLDKMEKLPTGQLTPSKLPLGAGRTGRADIGQNHTNGSNGNNLGDHMLDHMDGLCADGSDRPTREVKIINITIHANPLAG